MTGLPPDPTPDPAGDDQSVPSARRRHPERLGRFLVTDWLGMGGMGTVYRATDPQFDRPVALKVMSGAIAHVPEFRERFRREAAALARVTNPHVITIYDHGEQDGVLWLATQFVSGGELGDLIHDRGPLPPALALDVAAQVADALAASHAIGVLHRDVKPGNVLLRDADATRLHAYLCDFGIADTGVAGLTVTGGVAGTWEYLAPERAAGAPATAATDIYALGCLLWTCLVGRPPFTGSDVNVMLGHSEGPVPQLLETTPLHRELNALLTGCLAKQPGDRIPDAAQVRDRLDALRARVEATPPGEAGPIVPAPPPPPSGAAGRSRRRRTTALVAGATALVLAAGGLATWLALRGDDADDPAQGGTLPAATAGVRGDVDGDGLGDLVVKDAKDPEGDDPYRTVVLRSEKDTFAEPEEIGSGEYEPVIGDIDGDGRTELVAVDYQGKFTSYSLDGEEESQSAKGLEVSDDDFLEGMLADVNGDGYDDLVMASSRSTSSDRFVLWAARSTGEGFDDFTQVYESDRTRAKNVYPGDFDGDGDDDIVLVESDAETTEMLTSDGASYTSAWRGNNGGHIFDDAEVGDFDGDGVEELVFMSVFSGDDEQIAIARWADGRWKDEIWFTAEGKSLDLLYGNPGTAVADVDGDGRDDVIRFSHGEGAQARTIWVLTSDGKGLTKAQDWGTYVCECDEFFDDATSGLP